MHPPLESGDEEGEAGHGHRATSCDVQAQTAPQRMLLGAQARSLSQLQPLVPSRRVDTVPPEEGRVDVVSPSACKEAHSDGV